ncbi:hypothetical protein H4R18_001793 [Coemansia javaensis]|uniref:SCP domain-containing protein n=1 Tax=Coemansia javaensis TaxID=2761396 RepID=A0A9W8LL06_9FUNG|nr:hypothetical protein H4R18_001793 [Coemansia javaensis]
MKLAGVASFLALAAAAAAAPAKTVTVYDAPVTVTVYDAPVTVTVYDTEPAAVRFPFFSNLFRPRPKPRPTASSSADDDNTTPTATASSSSSSSEPTTTTSPNTGASDWITQMACEVNRVRSTRGLSPLAISQDLIKLAQGQSDYQNSIKQMTHSNPAGGLGDRLSAMGVSWSTAAENVAAGQRTPAEAQKAWENSPGHLANILNPGVSYFGAANNNNYYTQNFYGSNIKPKAGDIPVCN